MQIGKELIRMAATSALTFYDLLIEAFKQSTQNVV